MTELARELDAPIWVVTIAMTMTLMVAAVAMGGRFVLALRNNGRSSSNGSGEWRGKIGALIERGQELHKEQLEELSRLRITIEHMSTVLAQLGSLLSSHDSRSVSAIDQIAEIHDHIVGGDS